MTVITSAASSAPTLEVSAPSRLHFGLLNETGLSGRIDGGIGVALDRPRWRYRIRRAPSFSVSSRLEPELASALQANLTRLGDALGLGPLSIEIMDEVPLHAGLGSKTSLLSSLSRALFLMAGKSMGDRELAESVRRGGTSGVGTHLGSRGGLVVDAGRRYPDDKREFGPSSVSDSAPPALLLRLPPLKAFVVHLRFDRAGPSGAREREIFARTCPVPEHETKSILSEVVSRLLPAYAEANLGALQVGLQKLQNLGLKRAEWNAQEPITTAFRAHFQAEAGDLALCLSSMGPTVFVITDDPSRVLDAVATFTHTPLSCTTTRIADSGTVIRDR